MKFSVIIPCYNQGQYLNEAIDSVLSQTLPAYETIVIIDGATDNSLEIAQSYGDKIKVINQVNKGLASARNTGIMNSTGDYIFPLDADDIMKENCLEVVSRWVEETGADIIAPSFKSFGVNNQEFNLQDGVTLDHQLSANHIGYFSTIRRSKLLEIGGYNPKMKWGWEDWDAWIDLLKRGATLKVVPDILILYRVKAQSMIHTANAHGSELSAQMRLNHPELKWPN